LNVAWKGTIFPALKENNSCKCKILESKRANGSLNYKIQSPFWIFLKPFTNEPFARFDSKILHLQEIKSNGKDNELEYNFS
jgi:hypothetical protein